MRQDQWDVPGVPQALSGASEPSSPLLWEVVSGWRTREGAALAFWLWPGRGMGFQMQTEEEINQDAVSGTIPGPQTSSI